MGDLVTIEAGGGPVRACIAGTMESGTPGVLLLHAWWGLNDDVRAYADRLGEVGFAVLAPDMFDGQIASGVEDAEELSGSSDDKTIQAILPSALGALEERIGPDAPITALGFSFGAAWAIWAPTVLRRIGATVVYYGTWNEAEVIGGTSVPVLGHFAAEDPYETAEGVDAFEQLLRDAGRDVTIHRYPGTGHWFAEPSKEAYRPQAAELAFERSVEFLTAGARQAWPRFRAPFPG